MIGRVSWRLLIVIFVVIILIIVLYRGGWGLFRENPGDYEKLTNVNDDVSAQRTVAVTFGDKVYLDPALRLRDYLLNLSIDHTKLFDSVHCFNLSDIDESFKKKNEWILTQQRGLGYWIWKPYFCLRVWETLSFGDVLFYVDGGQKISNPEKLQEEMIRQAVRSENGGWAVTQPETQEEQTKGDVFHYMNIPMEGKKPQLWAGAFAVQKRRNNEDFFKEWLSICEVPNLIDDTPSRTPNHWSFSPVKFRHDQSVFSLLAYKYGFDVRSIRNFDVFYYDRPLSYQLTKMKNDIRLLLWG